MMKEKVSKEDQDWLDALAGKSPEGIAPQISAQASAVRQALTARREAIEADAIRVGDSGLSDIRARLQREGLMDSPGKSQPKNGWRRRVMDIFSFGSSGRGTKAAPIWGFAVMLMLTVLVTIQIRAPEEDEATILRGDASVTTLVVDHPLQRANELLAGLKPLTGAVDFSQPSGGRFQIRVQNSQDVSDFLAEQRIEPNVVGGYITIIVVPMKKQLTN